MCEILFKGFHKNENGKQKVFVNGEWIKGEWVEGNIIGDSVILLISVPILQTYWHWAQETETNKNNTAFVFTYGRGVQNKTVKI